MSKCKCVCTVCKTLVVFVCAQTLDPVDFYHVGKKNSETFQNIFKMMTEWWFLGRYTETMKLLQQFLPTLTEWEAGMGPKHHWNELKCVLTCLKQQQHRPCASALERELEWMFRAPADQSCSSTHSNTHTHVWKTIKHPHQIRSDQDKPSAHWLTDVASG